MKGNVGERPLWQFAEFSRMGDLIRKARLSDCSEVDPFVPGGRRSWIPAFAGMT
jgi:hypothetical protein